MKRKDTEEDDIELAIQLSIRDQGEGKEYSKVTPRSAKRQKKSVQIELSDEEEESKVSKTDSTVDVDLDYALALSLQDEEAKPSKNNHSTNNDNSRIYTKHPTTTTNISNKGTRFYLNKIQGLAQKDTFESVSFQQLLHEQLLYSSSVPSNLQRILLTTFMLDVDWLLEQFSNPVPLTIIRHWDSNSGDKKGIIQISPSIHIIHPHLPFDYTCMHPKLILLQFKSSLRVVVSSANLTSYDWNSIGQSIWFQDFPLKSNSTATNQTETTDFEQTLTEFLKSIDVAKIPNYNWCQQLSRYDFSDAQAVLIASIPGYHKGSVLYKYGHLKLRTAIQQSNVKEAKSSNKTGVSSVFEYQTSSVGVLYENFVKEFVQSLEGAEETRLKEGKAGKVGKGGKPAGKEEGNSELKILYPTYQNVKNSKYKAGAGCLMMQEKNWNAKWFPRDKFCDIINRTKSREGLVLHSKIIVKSMIKTNDDNKNNKKNEEKEKKGEERQVEWIYAGSHNLSMAAWGRLQLGGTQLYITNYELGVFLKRRRDTDAEHLTVPESFEGEIPFSQPSVPYSSEDLPFLGAKFFAENFD